MALNKDIKVAGLTILTIIAFIISYMFMRGTLLQSGNPEYYALFHNVEKLKKSDKVYLNGVSVGVVNKIEFEDIAHPTAVRLYFTADKNLKLPKDSKIQVISTSLMGNMGLNLILGNSADIVKSGESILGLDEQSIMTTMSNSIMPLASRSDTLLRNVNTLFDRRENENVYIMIGELNKTLASMNMAISNMNQIVVTNQKPIQQSMANFEKMSASLVSKQDDINQTIRNIKEITAKTNQGDIGAMIKKLDKSVSELSVMMNEVNNGNGSLTKLMKDPILYNNLNTTVVNANELMVDFKANPKRYVGFSIFGGKK